MLGGSRNALLYNFSNEGYLSREEAESLLDLVDQIKTDHPIVEIGVWAGKTTALLAEYLKVNNRPNKVYGIDPFETLETDPNLQPSRSGAEQAVAAFDNAKLIEGFSFDKKIIDRFKDISLLFIDGDHSEEGLTKDINNWLPKAREFVVFHDTNNGHRGVEAALAKARLELEPLAGSLGLWRVK